jgi:hypothetical protein
MLNKKDGMAAVNKERPEQLVKRQGLFAPNRVMPAKIERENSVIATIAAALVAVAAVRGSPTAAVSHHRKNFKLTHIFADFKLGFVTGLKAE